MKFHSDSSASRVLKNGVFTSVRFAVYTLTGIFFIPFLVRQYGSGTYGLIALAGFLTQYVGLISRCVGNAITRFLNIALNKNDWQQANEIFSTALVAKVAFIVVQIPLFALGIWKLDWLIDFPPEIGWDFRILVICNITIFFNSMIMGVIRTPIQASNRLDLNSKLDIIRLTCRLILLFGLIKTIGAKLWLIGVVDLGLTAFNNIALFVIYRMLAKNLIFRWKYVTTKWIKPIVNMAGWSMVTTLGGYLVLKTDIWMINRFVNKEMAGIYAALLVWPNFLRQVSKQLASILTPVYMIDYARGDLERVARLSLSSAKLLGCFTGFVVGWFWVLAGPLLDLWLGHAAVQYVTLFRIMLIYLIFTIGQAVLWQIYTTLNKVHFTGIVSMLAGVVNLVLSLALIYAGYGTVGVAVGTAIAQILSAALIIPIGVCREFNISIKVLWWNYICAGLLFIVAFVPLQLAVNIFEKSVCKSVLYFAALLGIGLGISIKVVFSDNEKQLIKRMLKMLLAKAGIT